MRPLTRTLLIGLAVSVCVALALAAAWWATLGRARDTLDAQLPAQAVLAYVEFPAGATPDAETIARIAPSIPGFPDDIAEGVVAMAAVTLPDGTDGWMTLRYDERGATHIEGTDPALATLLDDARPPLSADPSFADLRFPGDTWTYVANLGEGSALSGIFATDVPAAFSWTGDTLAVRMPLRPTPAIVSWSGRPLATLRNATHTVLLPSARAMARLDTILSPHAGLVARTVAGTFLDAYGRGLSLRYDVPLLLHGPSILHMGTNDGRATFSLEGRGATAANTDRILRRAHETFASTHGGSRVKTVKAEGFSLTTLTPEGRASTVETRDGTWVILRTETTDHALVSAHDGERFAITNDPESLFVQSSDAEPQQRFAVSSVTWTDGLAAGLRPLWPTLRPATDRIQVRLGNGPGYAEWTFGPVESL